MNIIPQWGPATENKNTPNQRVFFWRGSGFRISSPQWGAATENKNTPNQRVFFWRGGRDSNIIPSMGGPRPKTKTRPISVFFLAGRAGFEYHPLNGGPRPKTKTRPISVFFLAGRAGFEPATEFNPGTHLAGEPIQPLWHLPKCTYFTRWMRSGGSGIRTHVGVTQTCFQDMRLQPLGHPSSRSAGDFTIKKTGTGICESELGMSFPIPEYRLSNIES